MAKKLFKVSQNLPLQRTSPLWLEKLEDRRMLATFLVSNLGDLQFNNDDELETAPGTLRAAIEGSNETEEGDLILFDENLSGVIGLQSSGEDFGQLTITGSVTIIGLGAQKISVQAAAGRRIFEITADGEDPINVSIEGLTLTGGRATGADEGGWGGAILNNENLTLNEVEISSSIATYGGGIFNAGSLIVNRSLIDFNSANGNGGGIHNGVPTDDNTGGEETTATTTITSSTISGNSANEFSGYGGGVFNRDGNVTIRQSTIVDNEAYLGPGVGSWGNAVAEEEGDDPPAATIFTTISGSVLFNNNGNFLAEEKSADIDVVGKGEEPDEGEAPDLLPSINIDSEGTPGMAGGNNLIFIRGKQVEMSPGDLDQMTDPLFISNELGNPILGYYGGSTNTYHPAEGSPLIDYIEGGSGSFDQRGRFFDRSYEEGEQMMPHSDIGAVEVQKANFVVDMYGDEFDDGQYSSNSGVTTTGDFSVREALFFSQFNPLVDTITFEGVVGSGPDPTTSSAPTILLTNGSLTVNHTVNIVGPDSFVFELDAGGTGPGGGAVGRILNVTNGDDTTGVDVTVRNLTLTGGGVGGSGGAISNRENLTLENTNVKNNFASLDGGAIYHAVGELTLVGTSLSGNSAADDAALYIDSTSGPVTIFNTTISGNTAGDRGAGIFNRGSDTKISFSTITNNTPGSTRGGGILNFTGGHVEIYSSIISGNVFNNDVEAFLGGAGEVVSLGYNLVGTGNAAAAFSAALGDKFTTDPKLAPLALAGGLSPVHVLLDDSPAIDAGDPSAEAGQNGVPEFDQRGAPFVRVDPDNGIIDIGAYELQGVTFIVDNVGDVSNGDYSQGDVTLREALELANSSPKKDFITFDTSLLGGAIGAGSLAITDTVEIIGLGAQVLSITGDGLVFSINDGSAATLIDVDISGLTLLGRTITSTENVSLFDIDIRGTLDTAIVHQLGTLRLEQSTMTGNTGMSSGGAIRAQDGRLEIYSSTISGNSSHATNGHGGGLFLQNTDLYGYDAVVTGNFTFAGAADGGGIYAENSNVELEFSVLSGNSTSGANSDGAGIFAKNSNVNIHYYSTVALNSTFGTNSRGGAIFLDGGSLTISDNTTVILNKTLGQFSTGGFVHAVGADVNVLNTNISQNSTSGADAHGGAFYILDGNLQIQNSTVFDNDTFGLRSDGGGIYSDTNLTGKQTTVLNSTISGNSTQDQGGGLYNADGLTLISHSTISNNSAPYFGSGSGVGSRGDSTTTRTDVVSSIIAGNVVSAPLAGNVASDVDRIGGVFADTFRSLGYNLIGIGITNAFSSATNDYFGVEDPGLGVLTNNGGPSLTHPLTETSLAINGGDPSAVAGANGVPELDQRGELRIQNGRIDIGAFESDLSPPLAGDFNGDGVVNGRDFLAWQRGESPQPLSSSDLSNWQSNYGLPTGLSTIESMMVLEDRINAAILQLNAELSSPTTAPLVVDEAVTELQADSELPWTWWIDVEVTPDFAEAHEVKPEVSAASSLVDLKSEDDRSIELLTRDGVAGRSVRERPTGRNELVSPAMQDRTLWNDEVFDRIGAFDR